MNIDLGICQQCGENPATIQLTQLIGKEEAHVRLCQSCAAEQGVSITPDGIDISVEGLEEMNLLNGIEFDDEQDNIEEAGEAIHFSEDPEEFEKEFEALEEELHGGPIENPLRISSPKSKKAKFCPKCKTTIVEFKNSGILGCVNCYNVFNDEIEKVIPLSNRDDRYAGKNYRNLATEKVSLSSLKKELKVAIKHEEFELAASIRDQIQMLENSGGR